MRVRVGAEFSARRDEAVRLPEVAQEGPLGRHRLERVPVCLSMGSYEEVVALAVAGKHRSARHARRPDEPWRKEQRRGADGCRYARPARPGTKQRGGYHERHREHEDGANECEAAGERPGERPPRGRALLPGTCARVGAAHREERREAFAENERDVVLRVRVERVKARREQSEDAAPPSAHRHGEQEGRRAQDERLYEEDERLGASGASAQGGEKEGIAGRTKRLPLEDREERAVLDPDARDVEKTDRMDVVEPCAQGGRIPPVEQCFGGGHVRVAVGDDMRVDERYVDEAVKRCGRRGEERQTPEEGVGQLLRPQGAGDSTRLV